MIIDKSVQNNNSNTIQVHLQRHIYMYIYKNVHLYLAQDLRKERRLTFDGIGAFGGDKKIYDNNGFRAALA